MFRKIYVFLLVLAVFLPAPAFATIYYVAKTGNNANVGTEASPWLTIQKAADTMVAGDTVNVKGGTYNEVVTPKASGTEGSRITYQRFATDNVTIDRASAGNHTILFSLSFPSNFVTMNGFKVTGALRWNIYIEGKNNVILEDIESFNSGEQGVFVVSSNNITLTRPIARNNTQYGILISDTNNEIFIDNPLTHSNTLDGLRIFGTNGTRSATNIDIISPISHTNGRQGIKTGWADFVYILNPTTYGNGATGIQIENGTDHWIINGGDSHDNGTSFDQETGFWGDEGKFGLLQNSRSYRNSKGGFYSQSYNTIVRRNRFYSNKHQAKASPIDGANMTAWGDSEGSVDSGGQPVGLKDNVFVHNTSYDNGISTSNGHYWNVNSLASILDNKIKNNIFSQFAGIREIYVNDTDYVINHNCYFNSARVLNFKWGATDNLTFANWKTTSGQDANSINSDPLMVDPANGDFLLQSGSPCKDAGGFLTTANGSGTNSVTLIVNDSRYFMDGYGIITGDTIQIQGGGTAVITAVNYTTHTLTLATPLTWTTGNGVSYLYNGALPDIGYSETAGSPPPSDVNFFRRRIQ